MKRIVLILVSASLALGGCVSLATSKVRRSLFVLAMLSLSCLGFAHAAAVGMPATQAEEQAVEEMSFSLQTKNMAGADAVSNPESAIPKKSTIQASANNSNSARMLGGLWTFVETMGSSTFTDTYTFTSVDSSPNSSGDYYAWGVNKYGNLVIGAYNSSLGKWLVTDPISSTSGYNNVFAFTFSDDNHVSGCYYFYPKSGSPGTCYSFVGSRPVSAPGAYDGIYQWDAGYYLSVHQIGGGTLIGTIYWVYTSNSVPIGSRTISDVDTFDLLHGQIVGSNATMSGTRFYRACTMSYDLNFNSDSSLTVRITSVSNSLGVSTADVDCAARYNSVGSTWTIPKIY